MENKSSNNGVYWVIGLTVVGIGGYLIYQNWYNQNIKDNPAVKTYNWFNKIFN
jgi:uncharacterized protein YneF (UPF0154 family)